MIYGEGVILDINTNLFVDQVHTEEKIHYVVPMHVVDTMIKYDRTPQNDSWWTLNLSLEVTLT